MSKNETKMAQHELFDSLKENYVKRIDEIDAFSRRLSNAYADVSTEFLYGCLNFMQHYLDLQKKYSSQYSVLHYTDFISNMAKQNTEGWIQAVQNIDSICIESMKNMKNNLRAINKNSILCIQSIEKAYDIFENISPNHKIQEKPEIQKHQKNPPLQKQQEESKSVSKEASQT